MTLALLSFPRRSALALATCLGLLFCSGTTAFASPTERPPISGVPILGAGNTITGALPATQPIHIAVVLKLRNRLVLDDVIAAGLTLTQSQLAAEHYPTTGEAQAVANYLATMGFRNVSISANRLIISADGTAESAQAAFDTPFVRVQTQTGRLAYANSREAQMPAGIDSNVLSILGLDDVHQARTALVSEPLSVGGHDPMDFGDIYGGTGTPTAAGVTVGIVAVGSVVQTIADLTTFTQNHSLPPIATQTVGTLRSSDVSGMLEWNLDSQSIVGAAGGYVGKIVFYASRNYSFDALIASFNNAVTANVAKIISVSLVGCELNARGAISNASNQVFALGAAQGQTFVMATGDTGANACPGNPGFAPSWPANSPHVVAAAGTVLYASTATHSRETVWPLSGGSPSTYEPKPAWQGALVPGTKRVVADVAFDASPASGAKIIYRGALHKDQLGGTSLSAPIFAGLWARVIAAKGATVGFAAPILYKLPAIDFNDVTYGNNKGFNAGPGYDFASGRGSLILHSALAHIAGPANVAPSAGFSHTLVGLVIRVIDHSSDSDGTIVERSWSFGDGATSTATNPSHVYSKSGTYTVTQTVTDNGGQQATKTLPVTVGL